MKGFFRHLKEILKLGEGLDADTGQQVLKVYSLTKNKFMDIDLLCYRDVRMYFPQ